MEKGNRKFKGSLRLDWINKDFSLYYEIDDKAGKGVKPVWVPKNDIRVSEPRILKFVKNYGDSSYENMLIKGDNLLVLRSLVEMFKGKKEEDRVKCIYLDPPYNSGNAFQFYDDNLQHSEWLTMMRDRLKLLKKIMRNDGVIFVQISEDELAYLKCLMDEIFSRDNYLSTIVVKTKSGAGVGQESFLMTVNEYILVYAAFQKKKVENYVKYIKEPIGENVKQNYNIILVNPGKEKLVKTITAAKAGGIKVYKHDKYKIVSLGSKERTSQNYYKYFDKIFRTTNPQGGLMKKIMPQLPKGDFVSIMHTPSKGKHVGKAHRSYFYKGGLVVWLHETAEKDTANKTVSKLVKNNNFWEENLWQGIDPEGGVKFPQSKKPERIIKRILEMSTKNNDVVLDSFAGSGTTGAVAHKMNRRWIMVELGSHADELTLPRMTGVVGGKDQSGISREVSWKGGGGFKYYQLGESLINKKDMNWNLKLPEMAEAIFLHYQYKILEDGWLEKKGLYLGQHRSAKYHFALSIAARNMKVIGEDEYLEVIEHLTKERDFKHLTIFTNLPLAVPRESLNGKVMVKKIPATILREYNLI